MCYTVKTKHHRYYSNYYFPISSKTSSCPDDNLTESYRVIKKYGPFDGAIADIFLYIYNNFDLAGCYDPGCNVDKRTLKKFKMTLDTLTQIFGKKYIHAYNWQWISNQKRGKVWR